MIKFIIIFTSLLFLTACEEKRKPAIFLDSKVKLPINCLQLNPLEIDKKFDPVLKKLYNFDPNCSHILTLSYKKDIICNSSYNVVEKNLGKFPKSFLKLEVKKGFDTEYSYYIDLLENVDSDDVKEAFERLKKDILTKAEKQN